MHAHAMIVSPPAMCAQSRPLARGRAVVVRAESSGPGPVPGKKIRPFLKTPADLMALGPRAAFGALQSLPQLLSQLWVSAG